MKYVITLYADETRWDGLPPEERESEMERWMQVGEELTAAGVLVSGEELQPTATATTIVRTENGDALTDGPFAETKEQLGGFFLLDCADLDEALGWARKLPLRAPSSIEVRPAAAGDDGRS